MKKFLRFCILGLFLTGCVAVREPQPIYIAAAPIYIGPPVILMEPHVVPVPYYRPYFYPHHFPARNWR